MYIYSYGCLDVHVHAYVYAYVYDGADVCVGVCA